MHPVILIPGIGGSILVPRGHEYRPLIHRMVPDNRWIHIYAFSKKEIDKWKRDMTYEVAYDDNQRLTRMSPKYNIVPFDVGGTKGVKDIIPEFLLLPAQYQKILEDMFHSQYFAPICNSLYPKHYKDHKTLQGVPNDFRFILDPDVRRQFFADVKRCIEAGCVYGDDKAVIVTHSLGGVLFKWFLSECVSQAWIDRNIKRWVCISAPFGGSYQAVKAVTCGEHYISTFRPYVQYEMQRTTGIIMCLPNTLAFEKDTPLLCTEENGILTIDKYPEFAKNGITPFQIWRDLFEPHFDATICKKVSVPVHVIYSKNVATYGRAISKSWDSLHNMVETCDGDGIVPTESLLAYKKIFEASNATETCIDDSDHTLLLSDKATLDILHSYL